MSDVNHPMHRQMMDSIRSGSWLDFDQLAQNAGRQNEQMQQKRLEEAAIVQAALDTPQGRKFIDWLTAKTLLRPPSPEEQGAATAEAYAIAKARREGQNQVLFLIMQALHAPQTPGQ
ncbi:MAG: hypothetical protein ACLFPA_12710 [Dichotomicrobium sp.]